MARLDVQPGLSRHCHTLFTCCHASLLTEIVVMPQPHYMSKQPDAPEQSHLKESISRKDAKTQRNQMVVKQWRFTKEVIQLFCISIYFSSRTS
jgi:hypothetical protein